MCLHTSTTSTRIVRAQWHGNYDSSCTTSIAFVTDEAYPGITPCSRTMHRIRCINAVVRSTVGTAPSTGVSFPSDDKAATCVGEHATFGEERVSPVGQS